MSDTIGLAGARADTDSFVETAQVISWPKSAAPIRTVFAQSKEWQRISAYLALGMVDIVGFVAAYLAASLIRFGGLGWGHELELIVLAIPLLLWSALLGRAYSIRALESPRRSVGLSGRALLFTLTMIVAMTFYLKNGTDYSRLVIGMTSVFAVLFIGGGRLLLGRWLLRHFDGHFTNDLLIVDGVPAPSCPSVAILDAQAARISPTRNDPDMLDRIARLTRHSDRLLIACPPERREAWSATLKASRTNVEILLPELDVLKPLALRISAGVPAVTVAAAPLSLGNRVLKRLFDLAVAVPALLLLSPVLIACAVAIKLDSRGPIFFHQPRVGRSNRLFNVLKFRTMRADTLDHKGTRSTARDDDRITRVGGFLRRTSLDELPQLLNVVSGEMSLVGPRPHAVASRAEDRLFWEIDESYWDRHSVKPGMTGEAQVKGFRGATEKREDLLDRLQADIEYVNNWSLGRDIRIMLSTVRVLAHNRAF